MSWRTTGILFVVLVVVGGLVYWQSRQDEGEAAEPTPPFAAPESVPLFDEVTVEDVVRLDVVPAGGVKASFKHNDDGSWFMTVPTETTVISQTVTNSVTGLINTGSRRTLSPDENPLEAYGLLEPAREIVVAAQRDDQIVRHRLQVGNETPAGDAYYVLKEGDRRIHLMTKSTLDNVFALATNPPLPETLPAPMPSVPAAEGTVETTPAPTQPPALTPTPPS
ncbi:MAG TPA: DUF4340 domain-containing protein [Candidatus Binatia bacterium]|nr:DUF4340 domain-containing protein [Candidatus Binatia bacterium]